MSQQTARQQARSQALDAQTRARIRRVEQDKRRSGFAVQVMQSLAEGNATLAACEQRAGEALVKLTTEEGLSLREAVRRCGGTLTTRDASRLRRLVQAGAVQAGAVAGAAVKPDSVPVPDSSAAR